MKNVYIPVMIIGSTITKQQIKDKYLHFLSILQCMNNQEQSMGLPGCNHGIRKLLIR
jgi:hypothetical protein